MRERAAEELKPKMGRMGAEDPSRAFPAAPPVLLISGLDRKTALN
jgi:hypothetical protein